MPIKVHILATCRDSKLAHMTKLVFKTLRVGFPTAAVTVHLNGKCEDNCDSIITLLDGCSVQRVDTVHHEWIESLLKTEMEPFFICDTDVIFYANVEGWKFDGPIAGVKIPEWQDEFSGAITRTRLHTSLMYMAPAKIKTATDRFQNQLADTIFTPLANLIFPTITPLNGRAFFHDTCSLLYHATGGQAFTNEQKDAFFHFNFGTISDLVLPRLVGSVAMEDARNQIVDNPDMGRGAWRLQEEYYACRPVKSGANLKGVEPQDAETALKWNRMLCKDDPEAMDFNDIWYNYCHGIDDLIDTMEDGRPTMNGEQIMAVFGQAALLYNHPFYRKWSHFLFPVILLVTNSYADSVAWEKSPLNRRRIMADVLRTCGDEMYYIIAMIKDGWGHMRTVSPVIRERDWLGQHDKDDNPT